MSEAKIIADARALMAGDESRRDVFTTRLFDAAEDNANVIGALLKDHMVAKGVGNIEMVAGLCWLVGRAVGAVCNATGTPMEDHLIAVRSIIEAGAETMMDTDE